ncbi:MAG: DUF4760 domain-containing protein [Caulobacterales bacterium]|jgi:hypothetical protein
MGWKNWPQHIALVVFGALLGLQGPAVLKFLMGGEVLQSWLNASPLIQTAAAVVQTVIIGWSLWYAHKLYVQTRETNAQSKTLDRIFEEHADKDILRQRQIFRAIRDDPADRLENYVWFQEDFPRFEERVAHTTRRSPRRLRRVRNHAGVHVITKFDPSVSQKRTKSKSNPADVWRERNGAIVAILNRYETFALAIFRDAMDEELYRGWWRSTLLDDFDRLRPFISKARKNAPKAFIEFERLAMRWSGLTQTLPPP